MGTACRVLCAYVVYRCTVVAVEEEGGEGTWRGVAWIAWVDWSREPKSVLMCRIQGAGSEGIVDDGLHGREGVALWLER